MNGLSKHTASVVLSLSGGVDSSVAAVFLLERGYSVQAVMLKLWAEESCPVGGLAANRCCTPEAVSRASDVAALLDIPFLLLDVSELFFDEVVEYFISEYAAARTPNPCVVCNRAVRFGFLLQWALDNGADYLATGHYARVVREAECYQLLRGLDRSKDQSYALHRLDQLQLSHTLLPLGTHLKSEVRSIAQDRHLPVAEQPDSQDVCFVADGDYRRFLAQRSPNLIQPGQVIDRLGRVLGQHNGLVNYTVGQRKGLGLASPDPMYVLALDPAGNRLIVGKREELLQKECTVTQMSYVCDVPDSPFRAMAQIRYRHQGVPATAVVLDDNQHLRVVFDQPERAVTPGQYLVLYQGDTVVGGGVICAPP